uniref:Uncharacterized protein n=1 Tax=uncultured bacterium A1Q1_fos_291 TaxID=1256570 RepID=L7VSJ7_9BACT|nr:hypothetical protein [uncultured bacterium A1Q1_fos_291]
MESGIQSSYSTSSSATSSFGYRRGATDSDILAKTISPDFHESRRREEAILYIRLIDVNVVFHQIHG